MTSPASAPHLFAAVLALVHEACSTLAATGALPAGYAADDGAALHFQDGALVKVVAERPRAGVYHMLPSTSPTASGVLVEPLPVELL